METTLEAVTTTQTVTSHTHSSTHLEIRGNLDTIPYTFSLSLSDTGASFNVDISGNSSHINTLIVYFSTSDAIHGLGEQFSVLDLRGHRVPVLTREQGVGRGLQPVSDLINAADPHASGDLWTTYTCVPYIAMRNGTCGVLLETSNVSVWDFTKCRKANDGASSLACVEVLGARNVSGRVILADGWFQLCERYSGISGRMQPLPDWVKTR